MEPLQINDSAWTGRIVEGSNGKPEHILYPQDLLMYSTFNPYKFEWFWYLKHPKRGSVVVNRLIIKAIRRRNKYSSK